MSPRLSISVPSRSKTIARGGSMGGAYASASSGGRCSFPIPGHLDLPQPGLRRFEVGEDHLPLLGIFPEVLSLVWILGEIVQLEVRAVGDGELEIPMD